MAKEKASIKIENINYRLLLSTRKYLFGAIGLSAVIFLLFFAIIFPRIQQVNLHRQELKESQQLLQVSTQKLNLLQNVNQTTLFQERDRINALLPAYKPLLPLILRLEQLSSQTNVIVTAFDVSPGELSSSTDSAKKESTVVRQVVQPNVDSLPLSLSLYGSIDNIYRFLEGLDTLVPLADVTGISLESATGANPLATQSGEIEDATIFNSELTFQAYYYVGAVPVLTDDALPDAQLRPDLLAKLQTFQLPTVDSLQNIPSGVINGGKENLFE